MKCNPKWSKNEENKKFNVKEWGNKWKDENNKKELKIFNKSKKDKELRVINKNSKDVENNKFRLKNNNFNKKK